MTALVVVGTQWGDEGKGKIVDALAADANVVARYAGGPNAGHTLVVRGEKLVVRLVPSGILHPGSSCLLGRGMVVDPWELVRELDELTERGIDWRGRIHLSPRAHLILPHHRALDALREKAAGKNQRIGTTKRGIGPCYEDKAARRGVYAGMLRDLDRLEQRLRYAVESWRPVFDALGEPVPDVSETMERLRAVQPTLLSLLAPVTDLLHDALDKGQRVLLEGAQGSLLDLDFGTYPFVTSSSAVAGGACTGIGIGPGRIDRVLGVIKAYTTRVGEGPFPTELHDANGEHLCRVGHEFGSVTGRPRRAGWLDLPALRYAVRVNGLNAFVLTKLDVLTGLRDPKVCVAYRTPDGRQREVVPESWFDAPEQLEPVYETLPGWSQDLTGVESLDELPNEARNYVQFLEQQLGIPCAQVSVGPGREQLLDGRVAVWG